MSVRTGGVCTGGVHEVNELKAKMRRGVVPFLAGCPVRRGLPLYGRDFAGSHYIEGTS